MKAFFMLAIIIIFITGAGCLHTPAQPDIPNAALNSMDEEDILREPWNLTTNLPLNSTFTFNGYYSCIVAIPYKLRINQNGGTVTYTLEHIKDSKEVLLTENISLVQFAKFWQIIVSSNVGLMKSSYGNMKITSEFRGYLMIEITTETSHFLKKIDIQGQNIKDENFRRLINSMMEMISEDNRIIFLSEQSDFG